MRMRSNGHNEEIMLCIELHLSLFNYSLDVLIKSVVPCHKLCSLSNDVFFGVNKKTIDFISLFLRLNFDFILFIHFLFLLWNTIILKLIFSF